MKIMYLLNYIGDGGTEKYVMNLIQAADPKRCILVYSTPGPFLEKFQQMNIPIYQVTMSHPFDLQAAWRIRKIAYEEKATTIHTQFLRENYIAILAKRLGAHVRVIWTYHVDVPMPFPLKAFNKVFTRENDAIICVSRFMKKQLLKKGVPSHKLHVIYNGIPDPFVPTPIVRRKQKHIAVIGRLSKEKGLHFLLHGLAALRQSKPSIDWHCNIIGEGPLKAELASLAKELSLSGYVTFKGFQEEVLSAYIQNDIIVIPSENESLSYVAIEALAMKKPVVATNIGGLPEVIKNEETGLLIPYGDTNAFARAITLLLENEDLCASLGEHGRAHYLQNFTYTKMIEETFRLYRELPTI
ncbi:MAG: glycosyltransferase family 4 protein [Ectobacillus sp.]